MNLDKLDVIERATFELAMDLLRTRDRYYPHDPKLAAAFSSKAYEICKDLDIDCALVESMLDSPRGEISDVPITRIQSVKSVESDTEDEESDRALHDILGKQREIVGDQSREKMPEAKKELTFLSSKASMSQWFGRLQSA